MTRQVTRFLQAPPAPIAGSRHWPRAAVFDCDGLLVDTRACWRAAYQVAARAARASLDDVDLTSLEGASARSAAAELSRILAVPISAGAIAGALHDAVSTHPLRPLPGAARLLSALIAARIPIAVASNAALATVHVALTRSGLHSLTPVVLSAETTGRFKPDPDVFERACRELGVDPSDAIGLEDSGTGARSARRAGLTVIAVSAPPAPRHCADLAVPRLDDPRVFELFGIPRSPGRALAARRPVSPDSRTLP